MHYQSVILTGLNILDDQINEVKEYLSEKIPDLKIFKFDFKRLNYFLSDMMFNKLRKDEFNTFKPNTLIIWFDKSKSFKEYSSSQLYHLDVDESKTTLKLISDFDNIFFDLTTDNFHTDVIPSVIEILTCSDEKIQQLLFELS